jgi:hypothetical protein
MLLASICGPADVIAGRSGMDGMLALSCKLAGNTQICKRVLREETA